MNNWHDKKRLAEQLKFFGAKKQKFISCYAKKPRILITHKLDVLLSESQEAMKDLHLAAMQSQSKMAGLQGVQGLGMSYNQRAMSNGQSATGSYSSFGTGLLGSILGV